MIYFIQAEESKRVKIGHVSGDIDAVNKRRDQLQIGSPEALWILGHVEGDEQDKTDLHTQFIDFHVRGEWFEANPSLVEFIEENASFGLIFQINVGLKHKTEDLARMRKISRSDLISEMISRYFDEKDFQVQLTNDNWTLIKQRANGRSKDDVLHLAVAHYFSCPTGEPLSDF